MKTPPATLFVWLFTIAATLAALMAVAPETANANDRVECPGAYNVSVSSRSNTTATSQHPQGIVVTLHWDPKISIYDAAILCDGIVGFQAVTANGTPYFRQEWTALELLMEHRENGSIEYVIGRHFHGLVQGCDWSARLFTYPQGHDDWIVFHEPVVADRWGTVGCDRLSDLVAPAPRIGYAPVVSENPPSIDPT